MTYSSKNKIVKNANDLHYASNYWKKACILSPNQKKSSRKQFACWILIFKCLQWLKIVYGINKSLNYQIPTTVFSTNSARKSVIFPIQFHQVAETVNNHRIFFTAVRRKKWVMKTINPKAEEKP